MLPILSEGKWGWVGIVHMCAPVAAGLLSDVVSRRRRGRLAMETGRLTL